MQTFSLFPPGALDPIEGNADLAIRAILAILEAGHPLVLAYSGGKDTSMVAALALHGAALHHGKRHGGIATCCAGRMAAGGRYATQAVLITNSC